jgi:bacterioferritin-associated ferredoxin
MAKKSQRPQPREPNICWCNMVSQARIETAIRDGATTLDEIFDSTTAGVGACGGSCRPYIKRMLDYFLKDGTFPSHPRPTEKRK